MEKQEEKQIAEEQPLKGRARFVTIFKKDNPDADYENDDVFFDALDKYDAGQNEMLDKYKESSKKLSEIFSNNPEVGMFIADLNDGMDVLESISTHFGDVFTDDEEAKAKYRKGLEAHRNKAAALEEIERQKQANAEKYGAEVEAFVSKLPDDEKEAFAKFVGEAADKIYMWELDADFLSKMYKAMKYDTAVAEAEETGEVKGRNAQISMKREKMQTDGTPVIGRGRNTPKEEDLSPFSFKAGGSIWDKE